MGRPRRAFLHARGAIERTLVERTGREDADLQGVSREVEKMVVNDAAVVAELRELYPRYEEALITNDVETLTAMFWAAPEVMRFGVTENLYGIEELEAFRKGRPSAGLGRTVKRLDVVTFGKNYGSVTLEFERVLGDGRVVRGRQSQVWVRFGVGWRIVAAHVSVLG